MSASLKGRSKAKGIREWALTSLRTRLIQYANNFPPFGSKLGFVNGVTAADIVVCHRFVNKYEVPVVADKATRRAESIESMLALDAVPPEKIKISPHIRMAALRLKYWFKDFKPSYRFAAPSGASALPFGDEHDIVVKLSTLTNWEVSPQLFNYAFNIVWNNHALKRLVRARFREMYPHLHMNEANRERLGTFSGYHLFREQFRALVTFNAVPRVETVPKNNKEDRVITCEPLWNMICQLSFMLDMRTTLRRVLGYDINTRGDLHKTLLPHKCSTVDLKKASDFHTWELVQTIWPANMLKFLKDMRPEVIEYEDKDGNHKFHHLHMYAPMGNGTTFDVMTCSLLALLRFDRSASVFGDDIIIQRWATRRALRVLREAGLVVNVDKSFTSGKFRESCGGMWHDDVGYITSYDFPYPENISDVITLCNKFSLIIAAKQVSFELEGILLEARNRLLATLPRVVYTGTALELRSDGITGLSVKHGSTELSERLSVLWQRECTIYRAYASENLKSRAVVCPHTESALALWRGVTPPVRQRTQIVGKLTEAWSATTMRSIDTSSGFIIQ